jgi:hypothetical protein
MEKKNPVVDCILVAFKGDVKQNSNGKNYRWCTVAINGKNHPAMIYEKSYDITAEGETIKAELAPVGDVVMITAFNPAVAGGTPLPTKADFADLFNAI